VSNSEPTPAQLNVRLKFALVVGFFSHIKGLINIGYQKFNKGITPMNAVTSYHLKYAVTGIGPLYQLDYNKVIVSVGDLDELGESGAASVAVAEINFAWEVNPGMEYGKPTDKVSFLVYCASLFKFTQILKVVPRSALAYTMSVPAEFSGETVHCYLVVTSGDGKECSLSQHHSLTVL
jgi:hypothetical protein